MSEEEKRINNVVYETRLTDTEHCSLSLGHLNVVRNFFFLFNLDLVNNSPKFIRFFIV